MKKSIFMITLALMLTITACSTPSTSAEVSVNSTSSVSQNSSIASQAEALSGVPTLLDTLVLQSGATINNIGYNSKSSIGSTPLTFNYDAYIRMDAYGDKIKEIFDTVHVQGEIKELPQDFEPPQETTFMLDVVTGPELHTDSWYMPDGTVYLRSSSLVNLKTEVLGWYSFTLESDTYNNLVDKIKEAVSISRNDARSLYYPYPIESKFSPQTEVVGISISNYFTDLELALSDITFEKNVDGSWQSLNHTIEVSEKALPDQITYFYFDSDKIEGSRVEGDYRVNATLVAANGTKNPILVEYTIAENGNTIIAPPVINLELQKYTDKYMAPWGFSGIYFSDFDKNNYIQNTNIHLLADPIRFSKEADGEVSEVSEYRGEYTPAEKMETMIQSRFYFSTEELRKSHYYDAEQNGYKSPEGFGGMPPWPTVVKVLEDGNKLVLLSDWYHGEMGSITYVRTTVSMFDLEADGEFKIAASKSYEEKLPEDFDLSSVF